MTTRIPLVNVSGTLNELPAGDSLNAAILTGTASININGTVGATTPAAGTFTTATANSFIPNSATVPANGMYLSAANQVSLATNSTGHLTIGASGNISTTPSFYAQVNFTDNRTATGSTSQFGIINQCTVNSDVTSEFTGFRCYPTTQAASFTLAEIKDFIAYPATIGAGSTVTTQTGFQVDAGFTTGTNNYGFRGKIPAAANRYNLYMDGTAANYLAGATTVANTLTANSFIPSSSTVPTNGMYQRTTNTIDFATNSAQVMEISATGAIGIGTAPNNNMQINMSTSITGNVNMYGLSCTGTIASDVTTSYSFCNSGVSTAAASFTLTTLFHYSATQGTIGSGSTLTNQRGFSASSAIIGATNNYAFYGAIPAAAGRYNAYMSGTAPNLFAGDMQFSKTVTAAGTTGAQTINKTTGSVNFAAAATSLVVTNNLCTANSIIICTVGTNDATMTSVQAVAGTGSITLYANAAATAETRVNFHITN